MSRGRSLDYRDSAEGMPSVVDWKGEKIVPFRAAWELVETSDLGPIARIAVFSKNLQDVASTYAVIEKVTTGLAQSNSLSWPEGWPTPPAWFHAACLEAIAEWSSG